MTINQITEEEREKCSIVAEAFAELYEITDVLVVDAKKYGFLKLQYYKPETGFDLTQLYTDSRELFEELWNDWYCNELLELANGTPMVELDYADMFKCQSPEKQAEILSKRRYFADKAGISLT